MNVNYILLDVMVFLFWNKRLIKNSGFLIGFLIFFFWRDCNVKYGLEKLKLQEQNPKQNIY